MNLLITGATGFIGRNLITALEPNHNIYIYARISSNLADVSSKYNILFESDIHEIRSFLIKNKIEGIIHLASLFSPSHKESEIKELIDSNVYLGASLLEASIGSEVKWFLNTGTFWQYYIHNSSEYCPVNLYAATKQAFIDIAKYYIETTELKFVTLNICDTYGPNDPRIKILNLWIKIAISGEQLSMSPGEQYIDILYIDDVVNGFIRLIELLNTEEKTASNYALYSEKRYRLKDLAKIFEEVTGAKLNINWGKRPYRAREVMIPWEKGEKLLGWKPFISLSEGISKLYENYLELYKIE